MYSFRSDGPSTLFAMIKNLWNLLVGFAAFVVISLLATLPATWLLMLTFGNVGLTEMSYWSTLPLGILVSGLIGAAGNNETMNVFVRSPRAVADDDA
jgi:hypothetical protein